MAGRDVAAAGAEGGDEAGGKGTLDSTFQSQVGAVVRTAAAAAVSVCACATLELVVLSVAVCFPDVCSVSRI